MSQLEFGIGLRRMDAVAELARKAEDLGYDYVQVGEHVSFNVPVSNSFISLAVAAGATTRIKLINAIALVPLYPATLLAKLAASLDVASGGRFHLGVGVGGENPREFQACGVPVNERGARTNEALGLLRRLWTEEHVSFSGRFNTLEDITIAPQPTSLPHPPIWVSGRKEAAMRRTARYGDGWMPYMYTPEMLRDSLATIATMRADTDRAGDPVRAGQYLFFCVHRDRDEAHRQAIARLSKQYAQDFSKLVGKYAIAGTPDDCAERLRQYIDAGASSIFLSSACDNDYLERNEQLLAEAVMPAFR
ncbi:MAG: LLM class flavin-dependent oxidoreductase [Acidimicrobiia bacterium]